VAGLIEVATVSNTGMTEEQRAELTARGVGITNLVHRATVRASELDGEELREGGLRLAKLVDQIAPRVVAIAGITAYRTAFGERGATTGRQDRDGGPEMWVLPNPSGLNAHVTTSDLAEWFRTVAERAGLS
jgi:TDG/mug DNA glycosylase family protein